MKKVIARLNAGRWIVDCPIHGSAGAVLVEDAHSKDPSQSKFYMPDEYVCPVCFPGVTATFQAIEGKRLVTKPDTSARETARLMATAAKKVYKVTFPKEKRNIENLMAGRKMLHRNWDGESLEALESENKFLKGIGEM